MDHPLFMPLSKKVNTYIILLITPNNLNKESKMESISLVQREGISLIITKDKVSTGCEGNMVIPNSSDYETYRTDNSVTLVVGDDDIIETLEVWKGTGGEVSALFKVIDSYKARVTNPYLVFALDFDKKEMTLLMQGQNEASTDVRPIEMSLDEASYVIHIGVLGQRDGNTILPLRVVTVAPSEDYHEHIYNDYIHRDMGDEDILTLYTDCKEQSMLYFRDPGEEDGDWTALGTRHSDIIIDDIHSSVH